MKTLKRSNISSHIQYPTLGAALLAARASSQLTQIQIANHLGYTSAQFVSNWERGHSAPPRSTLQQLCNTWPEHYQYNPLALAWLEDTTVTRARSYGVDLRLFANELHAKHGGKA